MLKSKGFDYGLSLSFDGRYLIRGDVSNTINVFENQENA